MEHDTTCISRETCAYLPRPSISEVFQSRTLFLRPGMRFVLAVQAFSCWFMCFWVDKILATKTYPISNAQVMSYHVIASFLHHLTFPEALVTFHPIYHVVGKLNS